MIMVTASMNNLSDEVLAHIFHFLQRDYKALTNLERTCHRYQRLSTQFDEQCWGPASTTTTMQDLLDYDDSDDDDDESEYHYVPCYIDDDRFPTYRDRCCIQRAITLVHEEQRRSLENAFLSTLVIAGTEKHPYDVGYASGWEAFLQNVICKDHVGVLDRVLEAGRPMNVTFRVRGDAQGVLAELLEYAVLHVLREAFQIKMSHFERCDGSHEEYPVLEEADIQMTPSYQPVKESEDLWTFLMYHGNGCLDRTRFNHIIRRLARRAGIPYITYGATLTSSKWPGLTTTSGDDAVRSVGNFVVYFCSEILHPVCSQAMEFPVDPSHKTTLVGHETIHDKYPPPFENKHGQIVYTIVPGPMEKISARLGYAKKVYGAQWVVPGFSYNEDADVDEYRLNKKIEREQQQADDCYSCKFDDDDDVYYDNLLVYNDDDDLLVYDDDDHASGGDDDDDGDDDDEGYSNEKQEQKEEKDSTNNGTKVDAVGPTKEHRGEWQRLVVVVLIVCCAQSCLLLGFLVCSGWLLQK